jgi:hypothetical protein
VQNPKVIEDRSFNGFGTNFEGSPEPIYGPLFLPRKFKVAVTGAFAGRYAMVGRRPLSPPRTPSCMLMPARQRRPRMPW